LNFTDALDFQMKEKRFQIYGLGQCCLDYIGKVDTYPPPDVKCEFTDMVIEGGGPVATALAALARWGVSCTFVGLLGDDKFASVVHGTLAKEGVDTSGIIFRDGSASQFAFILAEPGVGRRTIFWRRATGAPPSPDELDFSTIRQAEVFYTDGHFVEASLAAARTAREAGVKVVVDAGSLREGMLDLARVSDYFLASETFSRGLVGEGQPLDACRRLAEFGPSVVAVTLGARGYVALTGDRIIEGPAYQVDAVDTTGCGDVFHAGFTYGLIKNWQVDKCLDFAAWAAAKVSLELGGRAGIPPIARIMDEGW
jgi:sulfofructose kinase